MYSINSELLVSGSISPTSLGPGLGYLGFVMFWGDLLEG